MTTTTIATDPAREEPRAADTIGFGNVLRSEWTKLRSLRSAYLSTGFVMLATVGLGILMGVRWAHQKGALDPAFDATNVSLSGFYIAQVIVGAVGVLTISSEYTTGMIRATFSAVPQRRAVLAAKALVVAGATFVIGEIASFASFGVCQALLVSKHAGVSLGDPGALRAVFGAGLYLTAVSLLGFGLGATIRHTAGALSGFFGILFAPTLIVDLLPTSWRNNLIDYMPANAGSQILTIVKVKGALPPWGGLGVFCLYAAAALLAGFALVRVRDA
ncbi:MAG: putative transporter transrane protein [Pseudonocardiales bacterium]|nr:putative transporter transrane protein [Pseudonocardiales bacterium]